MGSKNPGEPALAGLLALPSGILSRPVVILIGSDSLESAMGPAFVMVFLLPCNVPEHPLKWLAMMDESSLWRSRLKPAKGGSVGSLFHHLKVVADREPARSRLVCRPEARTIIRYCDHSCHRPALIYSRVISFCLMYRPSSPRFNGEPPFRTE